VGDLIITREENSVLSLDRIGAGFIIAKRLFLPDGNIMQPESRKGVEKDSQLRVQGLPVHFFIRFVLGESDLDFIIAYWNRRGREDIIADLGRSELCLSEFSLEKTHWVGLGRPFSMRSSSMNSRTLWIFELK